MYGSSSLSGHLISWEIVDNQLYAVQNGAGEVKQAVDISVSIVKFVEQTQTAITCPSCGNPMGKIPYNGGQTMIDSCSNCPYRWLDAGDIIAVTQKSVTL